MYLELTHHWKQIDILDQILLTHCCQVIWLAYLVTWVRVLKSRERIDFNTSMQPMYCKDKQKK